LGASGSEGCEAGHEEVQTWEGHQVDGELSQVRIKLTGEPQTAGDAGHGGRDEVVKVTVGGGGELEGSEADVVEGFVINDHTFVSVFDQLMD